MALMTDARLIDKFFWAHPANQAEAAQAAAQARRDLAA